MFNVQMALDVHVPFLYFRSMMSYCTHGDQSKFLFGRRVVLLKVYVWIIFDFLEAKNAVTNTLPGCDSILILVPKLQEEACYLCFLLN